MIAPSDLRLGNLVLCDESSSLILELTRIGPIVRQNGALAYYDYNRLSGIIISEEIVRELGVQITDAPINNGQLPLELKQISDGWQIFFDNRQISPRPVKWVHELQNSYYLIYRRDLDISAIYIDKKIPSIVIKHGNPSSLGIESFLEEIDKELKDKGVTIEVDVLASGLGVTFWEVLRIWVEDIPKELLDYVIGKLLDSWVRWAVRRFKSVPHRPKTIKLIDQDNNTLAERVMRPIPRIDVLDHATYFYRVTFIRIIDGEAVEHPPFYTFSRAEQNPTELREIIETSCWMNEIPFSEIKIIQIQPIAKEECRRNFNREANNDA